MHDPGARRQRHAVGLPRLQQAQLAARLAVEPEVAWWRQWNARGHHALAERPHSILTALNPLATASSRSSISVGRSSCSTMCSRTHSAIRCSRAPSPAAVTVASIPEIARFRWPSTET